MMLTTLDIVQIFLALGIIGWASRVLWAKWKAHKAPCAGDCVTCPSKLAGHCEGPEHAHSQSATSEAPDDELTQLPSRQRKKAHEDHV